MKKIKINVLALFLALFGCKFTGTDVGNPMGASSPDEEQNCDGSQRCMPTPYVQIQVGQICEVINRCSGVSATTCYDAVFDQSGLNQVLSKLPLDTYRELDAAYGKKQINVNPQAWNLCLDTIQNLDCQSETVHEIYSSDQPQNYSNIHKILFAHSSCLEIYSEK
jgi:hypothetical protein